MIDIILRGQYERGLQPMPGRRPFFFFFYRAFQLIERGSMENYMDLKYFIVEYIVSLWDETGEINRYSRGNLKE